MAQGYRHLVAQLRPNEGTPSVWRARVSTDAGGEPEPERPWMTLLGELGADGWELVTVIADPVRPGELLAFFKQSAAVR